jgi:hypothetical protein
MTVKSLYVATCLSLVTVSAHERPTVFKWPVADGGMLSGVAP